MSTLLIINKSICELEQSIIENQKIIDTTKKDSFGYEFQVQFRQQQIDRCKMLIKKNQKRIVQVLNFLNQ